MKRILLVTILVLNVLWANAESTIRVEVPNVVAVNEQFNLTFIVEGDKAPSDFNWNTSEDFQLVWGPQQGSSRSVQIINGKRTSSSQFTYTYILIPKKSGKFNIPAATAKLKKSEITSKSPIVEVVANGSSSTSSSSSSSGTSNPSVSGQISDNLEPPLMRISDITEQHSLSVMDEWISAVRDCT